MVGVPLFILLFDWLPVCRWRCSWAVCAAAAAIAIWCCKNRNCCKQGKKNLVRLNVGRHGKMIFLRVMRTTKLKGRHRDFSYTPCLHSCPACLFYLSKEVRSSIEQTSFHEIFLSFFFLSSPSFLYFFCGGEYLYQILSNLLFFF